MNPTSKKVIRPIAFVLPQYHPIPENDEWWGKGFTEWTNVTQAKPLFKGHYQPHLPTDLGFYDLRLKESRDAQASLAKEHGIYGFCYYHYWFNGKRLLHQPIDNMLHLKEPDMPFMLCWANENWTRRWDGKENEVLIKQEYSLEDDKAHMRWLCENAFSDERYIRVDGCPVFVLYRHSLLPDTKQTVKIWRDIAIKEYGFKDLYLCLTEGDVNLTPPTDLNFDATIEFSPRTLMKYKLRSNFIKQTLTKLGITKRPKYKTKDYKRGVRNSIQREIPSYKLFRSVTPSWDNTARKKEHGVIAIGSSPDLYEKWLRSLAEKFEPFSEDENFIFINAMNEWAEGNHLEPCIKYKDAYLKATHSALKDFVI